MQYFIPSDSVPRLRVLPTALNALSPAVARAAIQQHTRPGDIILDPFASGLGVIQAALALDRRIIAASFNPINALALRATLWPSDARSALTHLEAALKAAHRLHEGVLRFYKTSCPTCRQPATAQYFIWERDHQQPVEKHVVCAVCGENAGPASADDLKELKNLNPRGLPFWVLHNRVIDQQHEDADRVSDVLDVYTPRAQAALSDILLKFAALSEDDQTALRPALLATLDACTSLHTPDEVRYPSGLKSPARFIERNVWLELERQVALLLPNSDAFPRASTVEELLAADTPSVCLLVLPARELAQRLPARSISLIVTHPPLPRPGFWSLSAVWSAWLWGKQSGLVDHLLPLLSRKRTSWDWQWRAIGSALNVLTPTVCDAARVVMSFPAEEAILDSVSLAAVYAHHPVEALTCDPLDGVRATWRAGQAVRANEQGSPPTDGVEVLRSIVKDRAEPTHELVLRAGLLAAWGQTTVSPETAQQAEGEQTPLAALRGAIDHIWHSAALHQIEPHRWWLRPSPAPSRPLADRVEDRAYALLRAQAEWHGDELLQQIYQDFPGPLTPDRALVATVIHSYAEDLDFDHIRLRREDQAEVRAAEVAEMSDWLFQLGERFKLNVRKLEPSAGAQRLSWSNEEETLYTFFIQPTAQVQPLLQVAAGVLVIPGGRATLLQHKLARDPRLHQHRWQVLKCNSLRRAAQQNDLALSSFPLAFGLEPPIEQPALQIQLL